MDVDALKDGWIFKSEFHVKFQSKNRYRTNREAMSAISVFHVKFNVKFTSKVVNLP